jgi:predicted regulator of Ras-like GTPase activity (Roadblock/LC7/MglB family)
VSSSFGIIKRALRCYSNGEHFHALLELKNLVGIERDCWTAYLVKGKINAALRRYHEAIADYNLVLQMHPHLNERNRRQLLQSVALCATKLAEMQKAELETYFKKGPPPRRTKKRNHLTRAIGTSNSGKIASIGKFLVDTQDLKKLEHLLLLEDGVNCGINVVSLEAGQAFNKLVQNIDRLSGVVGSCIIGRDFFLRANTLPEEYDAEPFGINGLALFLSATQKDKLLGFHDGGQVVVFSELGYLLILEIGGLLLITLSNENEVSKLVKLANKIAKLVR